MSTLLFIFYTAFEGYMHNFHKITLFGLFFLIILLIPVLSDSLSYDMASGTLSDFSLSSADDESSPSYYLTSGEVWSQSGYIGRIIYTGPPTTLTISNNGPEAKGGYGRFYFTRLKTNGQRLLNRWREFFLVLRAKGYTHGNSQHDFSGHNSVIEYDGDSITIAYGAGPEQVAVGEEGYNTARGLGIYNGSNGYMYRYPYRTIWVDLTLVRTTRVSSLNTGYYESQLRLATTGNAHELLQLSGRYGTWAYGETPSFFFSLQKTIEEEFPFELLQATSSPSNSLEVGTCTYHSEDFAAEIRFASNAEGTDDTFMLTNSVGDSIPYSLAFDATKPNLAVQAVSASSVFSTQYATIYSPIGGASSSMEVLEGSVRMYLQGAYDPPSGLYSSTIYCFVTQVD